MIIMVIITKFSPVNPFDMGSYDINMVHIGKNLKPIIERLLRLS